MLPEEKADMQESTRRYHVIRSPTCKEFLSGTSGKTRLLSVRRVRHSSSPSDAQSL